MRILSWNILNGGQDDPDPHDVLQRRADVKRLDQIISVLQAGAYDVLVLQEADHFDRDNNARLHEIADALGMRGLLGTANSGFHVATFIPKRSKLLEISRSATGPFHAQQSVTLATNRNRLQIITHHLLPLSGQSRLEAVTKLGPHARQLHPVLAIGDYNAIDSIGDDFVGISKLRGDHKQRHLGADGLPDTRAIAAMHEMGFVDLHRALGTNAATVPTPLKQQTEFAPLRLDYAFGNDALARHVVNACVLTTDEVGRSSDHYAIEVTLDLELALWPSQEQAIPSTNALLR